MKRILLSVLLVALLLLTISPLAVQAKSDQPGRINAPNVELVKKVTLKGSAGKGGKPSPFAATGTVGTECTGNKYAIVIGINDYPGTSNDLRYAVADANEMRDVLISSEYGFLSSHVTLITNSAATYDAIQNAIDTVKGQAVDGDEVVFFFSGHGAKDRVDDYDSNNIDQSIVVWDNNKLGYIWDGELVQWFTGFKTNRIVFIFDSCLAGGMSVLNATGRVVNMACSANGYSYEGDWGDGHGQFTYYFVEQGMEYGSADVRPIDSQVTVEEAFDYAKANCKFQTPTITDGFKDDLLP